MARSLDCGRCEGMLADAVDGMLPKEEQEFFDAHIAECGPCAQLLAEARRGAAWLEMLRAPAPEPPPALLKKILDQTSGPMLHAAPLANPAPALAPGYTNVLHFPRRAAAGTRGALGRVFLEPRLAMTAAMAFFSIALTMDLMGVNPLELRAGDLTPSGLHRSFADLNARVVQYYEGLRVVYELESRVHDFENVQDNARDAAPAQIQQAPAAQTPSSDHSTEQQAQPAGRDRGAAPEDQNQSNPQGTSERQQPDGKSSLEPKAEPARRMVVLKDGSRAGRAVVSDGAPEEGDEFSGDGFPAFSDEHMQRESMQRRAA